MIEKLLDIKHLKATGCQPKWFGLGFIQLKLDEKNRMHFWHPDLLPDDAAFNEEFHDHRYGFQSRVLVGEITNELVNISHENGPFDYILNEVCCSGGGMTEIHHASISDPVTFTVSAGQSYSLAADVFHRVRVSRCVTLQTRTEELKTKARVLTRAGIPSSNPFDRSIDAETLWNYIEELLPRTPPMVDNPGYHLREIPRGELGEGSKIQEEVSEFLDAAEQGSRVMELVELSDMLGATQAYLDRHHPGYTLDDLRTFSGITQRAFESGHRS